MSVNKDIAGQKTTKWSLDQDQPYKNNLAELKMTQQIADQNKWNGISETVGAIGSAGTAFSNANLIPKGGGGSGSGTPGLMTDRTTDSLAVAPVETQTAQQQIQPQLQESSWNKFFGQNYQ